MTDSSFTLFKKPVTEHTAKPHAKDVLKKTLNNILALFDSFHFFVDIYMYNE